MSNYRKYRKSKSKKHHKKKNCRKRTKEDLSDSLLSNSDSSTKSDYTRKRRKNKKIHQEKYPIKLCTKLTAKFLTTAYKLKIIKLKLDEDPLKRRVYFITFIESLEMILSQYKENFEVLLYYPKIGEEGIKYFVKNSIRKLLHVDIYFISRILISEFPGDGVICISKLWSHCANMSFSEKVGMVEFSRKLDTKEGSQ